MSEVDTTAISEIVNKFLEIRRLLEGMEVHGSGDPALTDVPGAKLGLDYRMSTAGKYNRHVVVLESVGRFVKPRTNYWLDYWCVCTVTGKMPDPSKNAAWLHVGQAGVLLTYYDLSETVLCNSPAPFGVPKPGVNTDWLCKTWEVYVSECCVLQRALVRRGADALLSYSQLRTIYVGA